MTASRVKAAFLQFNTAGPNRAPNNGIQLANKKDSQVFRHTKTPRTKLAAAIPKAVGIDKATSLPYVTKD